jgi:hypothetical protein
MDRNWRGHKCAYVVGKRSPGAERRAGYVGKLQAQSVMRDSPSDL